MNVVHQDYYNRPNRKECWSEMEDTFGKDFTLSFCLGSAYKYAYRIGLKEGNPEEQELAKIKAYMNKARELSTSMIDEDLVLIMEEKLKDWGIDYGREE